VLLSNIISLKLYFYFYESAAQVNQDKKKVPPRVNSNERFHNWSFWVKNSGSGKREAVNRRADNTFTKIKIKMLNNDQQNNSVKIFDFSTVYTTIPHSKLKDILRELSNCAS